MHKGKHNTKRTRKDCADQQAYLLTYCIFNRADIFGDLRRQFPSIDGVVPCHLLLQQGLVVQLLQLHALRGTRITPTVKRGKCQLKLDVLSDQYPAPMMINFVNTSKPFSTARCLSQKRSVICPKNMRKKGKVSPASMEVNVPTAIYIFSVRSAYLKIERKVIFSYTKSRYSCSRDWVSSELWLSYIFYNQLQQRANITIGERFTTICLGRDIVGVDSNKIYIQQGIIIKYMGCGACGNLQVSDSSRSLQQRLLQKIGEVKSKGKLEDFKRFVSAEEIKMIENGLEPIHEGIRLEELHKLEAGEHALLTKERRVAWKVALFESSVSEEVHPFTQNPTSKDEATKSRFNEISLDINRTFPVITQLNRQHLTNVLENLTLCYEGIGYTQGMNFHIGFLLLCGFTPLESYQIFVRLSQRKEFLVIRNFCQNFKNVNACVKIMEEVMKESSNEVFKQIIQKIEALGMNLFLFVFSWFLSYFLYNFNIKASVLIWDYLILFPTHAINPTTENSGPAWKTSSFGCGFVNSLNFALRIMQSLSERLIQCNDISEIMTVLRHDAIEEHINQAKTEELLLKCRSQSLIDWPIFKQKCKAADPQLFDIIDDLEGIEAEKEGKGHFASYLNECKTVKRRENAQSFQ